MRANEFITERFDYSKYLPILRRIIKNTFHSINADEDLYDPASKVNQFFYDLQDDIDTHILKPLLKENPITINGNKVNHLLMSFRVNFEGGKPPRPGTLDVDAVNQQVATTLQQKYSKNQFTPSTDLTTSFLKTMTSFVGEATFGYEEDTHNGIINMDVRGSMIANFAFMSDDTKIVTTSLEVLTNDIIGKLMHEIKHYIQSSKVIKNMGYNAQVNRFYTGDPKKLSHPKTGGDYKNQLYDKSDSGYWLNADEMNSWATNAAAEINNVFGNDTASKNQYMNAVMSGKPFTYNGAPVDTTLNTYRNKIFDKRRRVNVDRNTLWRKFIKDVYHDVQLFSTSQKQPSKPQ